MTFADEDLLRRFVRPDQPFGPGDAALVKDPACAAALYDWNNRVFADMVAGSDVFVGRRGSGKSSLLKSFPARRFLRKELESDEGKAFRTRYNITKSDFKQVPDVVVEIHTPREVDALARHYAEDSAKYSFLPSVELIAESWARRLWLKIGEAICRQKTGIFVSVPDDLLAYIRNDDVAAIVSGQATHYGEMSPDTFVERMEAFLLSNKIRVVVTYDNVEQHDFSPIKNAVLGGLIAMTGQFTGEQHPSVDVKLCLPAEMFRTLEEIIFRPDKDMHSVQYLHWSSGELLHLAARRLKLYLSLWDVDEFNRVSDMPIGERTALRAFWRRYLPEQITNSIGVEEDTICYLLRHTQLLPRQLILILNTISRLRNPGRHLFDGPFGDEEIIRGIEYTEKINVNSVFAMFRKGYGTIDKMFRAVMPRFAREFDYGRLHHVWHSGAKPYMERIDKFDFMDFWQLMLATGALGLKVEEKTTAIYSMARFEYNTEHAIVISDKDRLCVHPMFSRLFNLQQDSSLKLVLPRGSDFLLEQDDI